MLRSHLRMKGRWQVFERNGKSTRHGTPWLVLRGEKSEAVLWHGPGARARRGPRSQPRPGHPRRPARLRRDARANCAAPTSGSRSARRSSTSGSSPGSATSGARRRSGAPRSLPGGRLGDVSDEELRSTLTEAAQLMRRSLDSGLRQRAVYRPGRAVRARAAAPRSSRAARATPIASRTGARPARQERRPAPCNWTRLRAPHLHSALRGFCLGAFALFSREVEEGAEIQFVFEEHDARGPADALRVPAARPQLRRGARRTAARAGDTAIALEALGREPAAAIFARAHAGARAEHALFRTVLLPLVGDVAEACGGFDWDDDAFDRAYAAPRALAVRRGARLRGRRSAGRRSRPAASSSSATASASATRPTVSSARTGRMRPSSSRRASAARPTACACSSSSARCRRPAREPPDAPGEIADAVTALRLATAGPIAAGPVLFERLDWRPYGVRPMLPIAATQPPGEPTRLDVFRGGIARS